MKEKLYVTYEEPFKGKRFTESQMQNIYRVMVAREEYPDYISWINDMLRSGVFVKSKQSGT